MTTANLILQALADGPSYGYAIRKAVLAASRGTVDLTFGALYAEMGNLLAEDYVCIDHEEYTAAGNLRRYYRLAWPNGRPAGYHVHVQPMPNAALPG